MDQELYSHSSFNTGISSDEDLYFDTIENYNDNNGDDNCETETSRRNPPLARQNKHFSHFDSRNLYTSRLQGTSPVFSQNFSDINYNQSSNFSTASPTSLSSHLNYRQSIQRSTINPVPRMASTYGSYSSTSDAHSLSSNDVTDAAAEIGRRFLLYTCGILFALCFLLPLLFEYILPLLRSSRDSSPPKPEQQQPPHVTGPASEIVKNEL